MTGSAPRTAIVVVCSASRLTHVRRQQRMLIEAASDAVRVLVWLDDTPPPEPDEVPEFAGAIVRHVRPGAAGLRLAAGRNTGADAAVAAGATLLVFLDADCLPGPTLLSRYRDAAARRPDALSCGPVTYLPEGVIPSTAEELTDSTAPHAARPSPPDGELTPAAADEHRLFWSLSFALTTRVWARIGGFDPAFEGYGGEDTDFAFRARAAEVPLVWVGGAHAYHQWHPTSNPPWQHLDDVLRNGALFAERWAEWPMEGWLERFAGAGAIRREGDGWVRALPPADDR